MLFDMLEKLLDAEPPRVRLANLPTRGHWLRYAVEGTRFWIKRDDQTGSELSGNKVRKLEYLFAEALEQDATHVITCGGEQSNHALKATNLATVKPDHSPVAYVDVQHPLANPGFRSHRPGLVLPLRRPDIYILAG